MQITLKLIYMDFVLMVLYKQQIAQVYFSSVSLNSDYQHAVFVYVCRQLITPKFYCFSLIYVAYFVKLQKDTNTLSSWL